MTKDMTPTNDAPVTVEQAIAQLRRWEDETPLYSGDDPRAAYYRQKRETLRLAIAALASAPAELPDMPEYAPDDISHLEGLASYLDSYARDKGRAGLPASKSLFEEIAKRLREYDTLRASAPAGWIVGNGDGTKWRTWGLYGSEWTTDRDKATRYARREDAEAVHAEDEDAWTVQPYAASAPAGDGFADAGKPIAPAGDGVEGRFWLIVREPGMLPRQEGPFRHADTAKVLREFIAANPRAFIDHLTIGADGKPWVDHGPEVLQMTDGRSMSVGRTHNARVREAAEEALARPRAAVGEREAEGLRIAEQQFEAIRLILIGQLEEPLRVAFWKAVEGRDAIRTILALQSLPLKGDEA